MNFIEFQNTKIGYNHPLITEVNLGLDLGEVCLLVGSNGMGKTTLMKTILGQVSVLDGQIFLNGKEVGKEVSLFEISKQVSMVYSKSQIPTYYTVWDLIALGKYIHYPYYFELKNEDKGEIETCIDKLGLGQYRNYRLTKLSDGNLQKAFIGRALVQNTPVILLDEPTAHLDEDNKIMILKLLKDISKKENKLILYTSHDWRLAKDFVDKIWWMKDGRIKEALVDNVLDKKFPTMEESLSFIM